MKLNKKKYETLSNITEEKEFELYGELIEYIEHSENINTLDIIECFSYIMNAYETVYHSKLNPHHAVMEEWLINNWDIDSIEMTEYITEITVRLGFKKLYKRIKDLSRNNNLTQEVLLELQDTVLEVGENL